MSGVVPEWRGPEAMARLIAEESAGLQRVVQQVGIERQR
jgi:hypothetical protein